MGSWLATYRGMLPDEMLDRLSVEEREASWRGRLEDPAADSFTLVAEDVRLRGFLTANAPSSDGDAGAHTAEIAALYVHPGAAGRGHGAALVSQALSRLSAAGFEEVTVWTLGVNSGARSFYERLGFVLDDATRNDRSGGIPEVRYRLPL